jgi:hypothetical protein
MTPGEKAELIAFARARIDEDRDRALALHEHKSKILETAAKTAPHEGVEGGLDPGAWFAALVAAGYRTHPDYRPEWDD